MQYIPIKTRVMQPPQDDLYSLLNEHLADMHENDIVLITSKIVSIHQGRCVSKDDAPDKKSLVLEESEYVTEGNPKYATSPLAIKYNAMFYAAGIDESNSNGYYTLLPSAPYDSAKEIWEYLTVRKKIKNLGVIITDSHSLPLRRGCIGISIGLWGFRPVKSHVGKPDLFGRKMELSHTNLADAIVAGASVVCGESNESTPIVIVRNAPNIEFCNCDVSAEILIPLEDDMYLPLLKVFHPRT